MTHCFLSTGGLDNCVKIWDVNRVLQEFDTDSDLTIPSSLVVWVLGQTKKICVFSITCQKFKAKQKICGFPITCQKLGQTKKICVFPIICQKIGQTKKICVFPITCQKKIGREGTIFIFFCNFFLPWVYGRKILTKYRKWWKNYTVPVWKD